MKSNKNILLLLFLYLSIILNTYAQVGVEPLRFGIHHAVPPKQTARLNVGNDTVSLPFYDDFSGSKHLNNKLWEQSGVTVNNNNAINPPTVNVITFDGIDSTGTPYNFFNSFAYGPCDKLVSKPIKLGGVSPTDSVYLSFFWQAGGIVELPDSVQTDSISVCFLSKTTKQWISVWKYVPDKDSLDPSKFNFVAIKIADSLCYNGSKFKIQSYGNQSGAWDNWHIDYIRIDTSKKYNSKSRYFNDFAINPLSSKLFKHYSVITIDQLRGFESTELNDSIAFNINNLTSGFFPLQFSNSISIESQHTDSTVHYDPLSRAYPTINTQNKTIDKGKLTNLPDSCVIVSKSAIYDPNLQNSDFNKSNDTIYSNYHVSNYLAYDDGTAEGAFAINQAAGRVLYKVKLNKPDTLTAVEFCWVKSIDNFSDATFKLIVMQNLDSTRITKQSLLVYGDSLNHFRRYQLDTGLIVKDSFYVGYEQNTANKLSLGFDKNNSSNENILYAIDYKFGTNSYNFKSFTKTKGSLMIRPVFERSYLTGKQRRDNSKKEVSIFYEPNEAIINIIEDTISSVNVFNMYGAEVSNKQFSLGFNSNSKNQTIDLSKLEAGIYILYLYKNDIPTIKKVFIKP